MLLESLPELRFRLPCSGIKIHLESSKVDRAGDGGMLGETCSVHGVSIRLTEERWQHIVDARDELIDRECDVLEAIHSPDWVTKGYRGSFVAWKGYGRRGYLAVIYKELDDDGFIITAFFTRKPKKRGKIWPK